MKLVALLSWYEEAPEWLAATVASLSPFVDHLVAVDGAYLLFPSALERPRSGTEQSRAIVEVSDALGIGVTLYRPNEAFAGNEVEKRNLLFDLARCGTTEDDWWLHIDGDERVVRWPADLKERLAATELDVASITFEQRHVNQPNPINGQSVPHLNPLPRRSSFGGHRVLTRALRDLRVEGVHYHYVAGGSFGDDRAGAPARYLRAEASHPYLAEALPLEDLVVEHLHDFRQTARNIDAASYYERRDRMVVERTHRVMIRSREGGFTEPTRPRPPQPEPDYEHKGARWSR
jgi:hypothetical protein